MSSEVESNSTSAGGAAEEDGLPGEEDEGPDLGRDRRGRRPLRVEEAERAEEAQAGTRHLQGHLDCSRGCR